MRTAPVKLQEGERIDELWETCYKPKILSYRQVPIELVSEVLGRSVGVIQEMLCSGCYPFGEARQCQYDRRFEIFPLRFIAWYEGRM